HTLVATRPSVGIPSESCEKCAAALPSFCTSAESLADIAQPARGCHVKIAARRVRRVPFFADFCAVRPVVEAGTGFVNSCIGFCKSLECRFRRKEQRRNVESKGDRTRGGSC